MIEDSIFSTVNPHFLEKVVDLSTAKDVQASEDIFDARGVKLLAKGSKISSTVQERLILLKLRKPLELCITVDGAVDSGSVMRETQLLSETIEPVRLMIKAVGDSGRPPLEIMEHAKFGNAMGMMLTIVDRGGPTALSHSVIVSLVAICLAKKLKLPLLDQANLALAGLLHDIGELYIAPEYLTKRTQRLKPDEWRHVIIHPRVGEMLIRDLDHCHPSVSRAVAEHHERSNGSGYPRQLAGKAISPMGKILSVAEMMAGIFTRPGQELKRAALAMRIVPGEHPHELISAMAHMFQQTTQGQENSLQEINAKRAQTDVLKLHECICSVLTMARAMLEAPAFQAKRSHDLILQVMQHTVVVKAAFSSTGLDICLNEDENSFATIEKEILFEIEVASREIQWRLRDIARNLALQLGAHAADEREHYQPLVLLLDEGI